MSEVTTSAVDKASHFDFQRDVLAFANETSWRYSLDASTGKQITEWRDPKPDFTLRCFGLVRVTKQFFLHARFRGGGARPDSERSRRLAGRVLGRDCRARQRSEDPVEIGGYSGLREFSAANEGLLKRLCGGPWRSYFQRGNWRMPLPFSRRNQEGAAEALKAVLGRGVPQALHVFQFPALGVNHAVLPYDFVEAPEWIDFAAYDPNSPEEPLTLRFDRSLRGFVMPATHYFIGGPVNAYTVFRDWLY